MIPQETQTLEQKAFIKGCQKFQICSDGDLEVSFRRLATQRQFRIPLWQINPKWERHKFQKAGNWAGFLIFGALALLVLFGIISCLRSKPDRDVAIVLLFPLIFLGIFSWVCFWRLKTQSVDAIIFYTREGGQIHVWFEKPDAKTFHSFCETLSKKCDQAWNNRPVEPGTQSMAGEIAALKKLLDSGVLSAAEFERAKSRLFDQVEEKKIGFAK
jgi:hypothetical protein